MRTSSFFLGLLIFYGSFSSALEIQFLNEADCTSPQHSAMCRAYQGAVGSWTEQEANLLRSSFPTAALGQFAVLEEKLRQAGIKKISLLRLKEGSKKESLVAEPYHTGDQAYMLMGSEFFRFNMIYPSGVNFQTHTLIHELAHLNIVSTVNYDFNSPFWKNLAEATAWSVPGGFYHFEFSKGYRKASDDSRAQVRAKNYKKAAEIEFAFTRNAGFPSLYSMGKLLEFEAELIAFLVHDSTLEKDLSQDLKKWLVTAGYGDLLSSYRPIPETKYRAGSTLKHGNFEFVGVLYNESRTLCTVSIVRHGLLVTAKHCLADFASLLTPGSRPMFLTVKFPYARTPVLLTGFNLVNSELDAGDNDLAYFEYDKNLTERSIVVPEIEWSQTPLDYQVGDTVIVPSFRFPQKIRKQKMGIQECKIEAATGRLDHAIPVYKGEFQDSTCTGYNLASGSPFFKKTSRGLKLIGILSHTFKIDFQTGQFLPEAMKMDEWGPYTTTVFSPAYTAKSRTPLKTASSSLSKTQMALIQSAEQKLREVVALRQSAAPDQRIATARIQFGVKVRIAMAMKVSKEQLLAAMAELLSGREPSGTLIEDELVVSTDPLSTSAFRWAMDELTALP